MFAIDEKVLKVTLKQQGTSVIVCVDSWDVFLLGVSTASNSAKRMNGIRISSGIDIDDKGRIILIDE